MGRSQGNLVLAGDRQGEFGSCLKRVAEAQGEGEGGGVGQHRWGEEEGFVPVFTSSPRLIFFNKHTIASHSERLAHRATLEPRYKLSYSAPCCHGCMPSTRTAGLSDPIIHKPMFSHFYRVTKRFKLNLGGGVQIIITQIGANQTATMRPPPWR